MRTALFALVLAAGVSPVAVGQDGGSTVASVPDYFPEALVGPTTGEPALPTPPPPSPIAIQPAEGEQPVNGGAVHLSLGLDFSNAYYSRGLRQEDGGFLAQPWATVGFDLVNNDGWTLQAYGGSWNSLHSEKTGASNPDETDAAWYESDAYFGVTATAGRWELGAQYGWFTSPSSAFTTVEELQFTASYDDEGALGGWTLGPGAMLVIETGDGTSDGMGKGAYVQLSVEPGCGCGAVEGLGFSFPVIAGFSASDYYERAGGGDDFLGFVSVGAKAEYALPCGHRYGEWSCYVAANVLFLGDLAKEVNDGDGSALVVSAGVSMEY
ncbi:MAG: hypothetical protein U0637_00790 [Phycisphaerales bacterium]